MAEKVELVFHDYPDEKPTEFGNYLIDTQWGFDVAEYKESYESIREGNILGFWTYDYDGCEVVYREREVFRWAELPESKRNGGEQP